MPVWLTAADGPVSISAIRLAAAVRLAICNDIGEASYTTSLVAAQFVELLRSLDGAKHRLAALEARYRIAPGNLTGEAFVAALAERAADGDTERAGRRILVRDVARLVVACDALGRAAFFAAHRKTTRRGAWACSAWSRRRARGMRRRARGSLTARRGASCAPPRRRSAERYAMRRDHRRANNNCCKTIHK